MKYFDRKQQQENNNNKNKQHEIHNVNNVFSKRFLLIFSKNLQRIINKIFLFSYLHKLKIKLLTVNSLS